MLDVTKGEGILRPADNLAELSCELTAGPHRLEELRKLS